MENLETSEIATIFKALGDPTRLRIFEFLRGCCNAVAIEENGDVRPVVGMTVGEVCCSISGEEKITSTLSHHIKELRLAGLINMERQGKNILCCINQKALNQLAHYFQSENSEAETLNERKGKEKNEHCC